MAIQKRKSSVGMSADEIVIRLQAVGVAASVERVAVAMSDLGLSGTEADVSYLADYFAAGGAASVQPAVQVQPSPTSIPAVSVADIVAGAKRQAAESVVQTAGKLGDATADFMGMLQQEIDAERQAQYRPAAQQLAKQIVASEGAMVGKSVGQLCTFISELNLFEGTELEALAPAPIPTLALPVGS
jgi:hypothetical protein